MTMILHSVLSEANLHNAKGFTLTTNGNAVWRDERGVQSWDNRNVLPAALALAIASSVPPTEVDGAIYLLNNTTPHANWDGCLQNTWVRFSTADGLWKSITPVEGVLCYDKVYKTLRCFNGTIWVFPPYIAESSDGHKWRYTSGNDGYLIQPGEDLGI